MGGRGDGALKWKPKTQLKDGPIGCQTSSSINVGSGSYVTVVLKEPNSSSFRHSVLIVIFHKKNFGTLCQVSTRSDDVSSRVKISGCLFLEEPVSFSKTRAVMSPTSFHRVVVTAMDREL